MSFPYSRKSKSEVDTVLIADDFSSKLKNGMIIILNGDLGAGKTFFIKHVLQKFGINNTNSPTFAIVNEYMGDKVFYHFDFYRINKETELHDIGIEDYFNDEQSIIFIEWGNLFPHVLPKKRIEINISYINDNEREFNFIEYE
ncbi:MAG: tRNA (adenosine(37)-N6)-threonylcarbamoyltransferase complex ATPase subunit type 1 TsaE [Ignavibacteriales bacterium]|nr:tRNA (adenosine(37)-N6)-threonylcarbamoyltransferase complex ATPase subunit type 1 TsaE [Ignavibacteriales bacterium]MBP9120406.1 tRNA (adenosine(37)-N6)-threonylcarbamoyltransferase complex ATPase subunit type 1 TsaE [Ignavibacterium sp.]